MSWHPYWLALGAILSVGVISWLVSLVKKDVSFVDSLWSLFFLIAAVVFAVQSVPLSERAILVLVLVTIWSLRLSIYITARNWGQPEDYRYQSIRENNEPGFGEPVYRIRLTGRFGLDYCAATVRVDRFRLCSYRPGLCRSGTLVSRNGIRSGWRLSVVTIQSGPRQ